MNKEPLKEIAKAGLGILPPPSRETLIMSALLRYIPNIKKPAAFNEKIAHRKLCQYDPCFQRLADKIAVREYVQETVGEEYLSKIWGVAATSEDVQWDELPNSFVAKPAHGTKSIRFVDDKDAVDKGAFLKEMEGWLRTTYGVFQNEYWYAEMPKRVLVEERLIDERFDIPTDFKFFVFHGHAHYVQVDLERLHGHKRTFYDLRWQALPIKLTYPVAKPIPQPKKMAEMVEVAEALGAGLDFVRVDLYCLNDERIVFGELTFAPGAGHERFQPGTYDQQFGQLW